MTIRTIVRSVLAPWSKPQCPAYDYKMPVVILLLLVWYIPWYFCLPPGYPYDPYGGGIIILIVLLNYLDGQARWFKWRVAGVLHVLSWGWLAFSFFYFIYWSHVLYPIQAPGAN